MIHKFPKPVRNHSDNNPRYLSGTSLVRTEKEVAIDDLCEALGVDQLEPLVENNFKHISIYSLRKLAEHIKRRIRDEQHNILAANTTGTKKNPISGK